MSEHPKADLYRAERAKGLTYREIGEKYGVSGQYIAMICGKSDGRNFRAWTEKTCIYPNLRNWLNENKVSLNEFVRRNGVEVAGNTAGRFRAYLNGRTYPPKKTIDRMLKVTGLTYEQLWEVD
jgi:transcriptional regulator with XRE-family HTH domain